MKYLFVAFALLLTTGAGAQSNKINLSVPDSTKPVQTVEVACGLCKFGMQANECTLAVRIKGKSYFVDGTSLDDWGDAHDKHGFCMRVRKAEVQGTLVKNRFVVTYFKLLPPSGRMD